MSVILHETCQQYVARRLSEGWKVAKQEGFLVILESPDGIIRPVDLRNDTETLRPNAAGDETVLDPWGEANNYACVDEASADDDTTSVFNYNSTSYQRDLYNLPASSGSGTINFIKVYFRCEEYAANGYAKPAIKSDSAVTDGTEVGLTTSWVTYSQQWNNNPADSQPWEWTDIDALQIGVSLKRSGGTPLCTQVYVEVDYTEGAAGIAHPIISDNGIHSAIFGGQVVR